jgi:hypothetical protein
MGRRFSFTQRGFKSAALEGILMGENKRELVDICPQSKDRCGIIKARYRVYLHSFRSIFLICGCLMQNALLLVESSDISLLSPSPSKKKAGDFTVGDRCISERRKES